MFKKIAAIILISLFVVIGLKGCIYEPWKRPKSPSWYSIHGKDGRSLSLLFIKKGYVIIHYTSTNDRSSEAVVAKISGEYAKHYIWRIWNVSGQRTPTSLWGLRIFPEGVTPVNTETKVLKKYIENTSESALRNVGDVTTSLILESDRAILFNDMWLEKTEFDSTAANEIIRKLKCEDCKI